MASLDSILENALTSYLRVFGTRLGNVQILDIRDSHAVLSIAAQRGFRRPFLKAFATVSAEDDSACGRALRHRKSVIIPDVDEDVDFAPFRGIAHDAGYRGVISTPLCTSWGHVVGVISTHFPQPHRPSAAHIAEGEVIALDLAHDILDTVDMLGDSAKTAAVRASYPSSRRLS
jgi:GAF domain-containing protein